MSARTSWTAWISSKVVEGALAESGARADRLTLELTEHVMLDDFEAVNAVMQRLQALGLHFALDDFGTGYSSLSYLKRLPIDTLKIDRSFVRDIETQRERPRDRADDSEHRPQPQDLRRRGGRGDGDAGRAPAAARLPHLPGILFGRPMPEDAFLTYLEAGNETSGEVRRMRALH